jgi:hypothetical protein
MCKLRPHFEGSRCSIYLLYWCKSTCFTNTKVLVKMSDKETLATEVRSLLALLVHNYLLYFLY